MTFRLQNFNACLNDGAKINGRDTVSRPYALLKHGPHYPWGGTVAGIGTALEEVSFAVKNKCWVVKF